MLFNLEKIQLFPKNSNFFQKNQPCKPLRKPQARLLDGLALKSPWSQLNGPDAKHVEGHGGAVDHLSAVTLDMLLIIQDKGTMGLPLDWIVGQVGRFISHNSCKYGTTGGVFVEGDSYGMLPLFRLSPVGGTHVFKV